MKVCIEPRGKSQRIRSRALALILAASSALVSPAALAQAAAPAAPQIPAAAKQGQPTREEVDRGDVNNQAAQNGKLSVEGGPERAPCPLADPQYADVKITISGVQFDNLKGASPDSLKGSWEEFAGHEVPVATVCEIRDRAATTLRAQGYLAAVQVPPQRIEKDGVVHFDVLMAKLVGVQVRGDAGRSEALIAAHLNAIKDEPVFNVHEAERHLLLAGDLPGFDVRLTLRPANTAPGEVIGEVTVTRQPVNLVVNVQNLGSQAVGRYGGLVRLQLNDLIGQGDSTVFSIFNTAQTREQTVLQAGHSFAWGSDGVRVGGNFTYAWSRPSVAGGIVSSRTVLATLDASYPIVRRQSHNLLLTGGMDFINQHVKLGGAPTILDKLRVAFVKIDADAIDPGSITSTIGYSATVPKWRLTGSLELRQGFGIFGASKSCGPLLARCTTFPTISQLAGKPDAFIVRAAALMEYRPIPDISFSLTPRLQYSPDVLLNYEDFSAGNYTVGRGYDPGVIQGDSGAGFSAEIAYGKLAPSSIDAIALQPFAFFDAAWVWHNDPQQNSNDPQRLYSVGGGVHGAWGNHARFDLTLAAPLRKTGFQTSKGDVRVLFTITAQLVPWSQ